MAAPLNVWPTNYFPATNGGYSMWSSYNGAAYQADMVTAKNLGFNTMRVFLAANNIAFNFETPTSPQLANLTDFYNRAKTVGIKLHLTLFDQFGVYGAISSSEVWISAILGALPDTTALQCVEIQNEIAFASTATYTGGFDAGWPGGTPEYTQVGEVATVWAQLMIPYVRTVVSGIPVTLSCTNGTPDITVAVANLTGSSLPSWFEWHCYVTPGTVYENIQAVIAVVGNAANLAIGEAGASSAASGAISAAQAAQAEADYIQEVRWVCWQLGMPEPDPWILFDMNACAQFPSGQTYGLLTTTGASKPASLMYQTIPPGSTAILSVGINGNMSGSVTDGNGNVIPIRWSIYKGNSGTQPIVASIDTTSANKYQGNPAVLLTGSGSSSGGDNPPALQAIPVTAPFVSPGQSYTFSAGIKGTGSTASPNLEIAWYDKSGNFLSSTNGSALSLTSSYVRYSLSSTAPANAAFAHCLVSVASNAGSIWIGGAVWSGPSPRIVRRGATWGRLT